MSFTIFPGVFFLALLLLVFCCCKCKRVSELREFITAWQIHFHVFERDIISLFRGVARCTSIARPMLTDALTKMNINVKQNNGTY